MEIKNVLVKDIKYAPYNPRKISDEVLSKLKRSIEEFGYIEPIVVNKRTMHVVGGNQRLKVLRQLGIEEVQAVIVDLDDTHEKALNIALNKINGEWDLPLLKDLLLEIDTGEIDTEITGFDMPEIEELMNQFHIKGEEDDFNVDQAVEEIKEPITKTGDIWLLGKHQVMCGDATKKEDVERLMDGKKADSMITDPPYGVDYSGKNEFLNKFDKGNRIQKPIDNDAITDYRQFFSAFMGLAPLAEYNTVYIFMFGKELHSLRLALDDCGYSWGDYLVWVKNNHVLGRKDYNAKHELVVYGWKGKHKFYGGFSTTVLEFDRPLRSDLHPTMKPIPLLAKLINDGLPAKGKVYDPFGGSGSTLIACEQTNRICYMMEIDPVYCDVIVRRWEQYTGKKAELLR